MDAYKPITTFEKKAMMLKGYDGKSLAKFLVKLIFFMQIDVEIKNRSRLCD